MPRIPILPLRGWASSGTGEAGSHSQSGPRILPSTMVTKAPRSSVRTTVRTIIVVAGILIVAMWIRGGFSLVASRQQALDDARSHSRYIMVAFREEIAHILLGVAAEMDGIAQRMRRERGNFDLYAW